MKIAVCIKQVPATTEVKFDPETNALNESEVATSGAVACQKAQVGYMYWFADVVWETYPPSDGLRRLVNMRLTNTANANSNIMQYTQLQSFPSTLDSDGEMVTLGGGDELWSRATDINNVGKAIWTREMPDPVETQRAYRWDSENGSVPLALLNGTSWNAAGAINDSGLIVGRSGYHAVLWTSPDSVIDLGTGGACGIDNHGQISGRTGRKSSPLES